jgi:ABC-type lipoprotein export system ATPase subunit
MALLELHDLIKRYVSPDGEVNVVLDVPHFRMDADEQVALRGTSGSGKTTLLNIIAGILTADEGAVIFDDTWVTKLTESERDLYRARNLGYVFQTFNLLGGYSALENVVLGMSFGPGKDAAFAQDLLERLGLGDRLHHRPHQMSIGQQQRVALARALANRPRLVLADEPTGNLDPQSAGAAIDLIREMCRDQGAALLVVSHDQNILGRFDRIDDLADVNRAFGGVRS